MYNQPEPFEKAILCIKNLLKCIKQAGGGMTDISRYKSIRYAIHTSLHSLPYLCSFSYYR